MKGILLALTGVIILTPDALLMRLSGMEGVQMVAWRGLSMGCLFLIAAGLLGQWRSAPKLISGAGATIIFVQIGNSALFPMGIAMAPVTLVLLALATTPVWAAVLSHLLYREPTPRSTWITILCVVIGIALAMSGKSIAEFGANTIGGVLCGIGVAIALALNFTTLRHNPDLPLLPAVGLGAFLAGGLCLTLTGPANMISGTLWPILLASIAVLPLSFFLLSYASRFTTAANVSLIMLLETVLGPLWVWLGYGEAPTARMLAGGAIVLTSITAYIWHMRRR